MDQKNQAQKTIAILERGEIYLIFVLLAAEIILSSILLIWNIARPFVMDGEMAQEVARLWAGNDAEKIGALSMSEWIVGYFAGGEFDAFVESFLKIGLIWLGFLGGSLAITKRKNIAIDLLPQLVNKDKLWIFDKIVTVVGILVSILFFIMAMAFVMNGFSELYGSGDLAGKVAQYEKIGQRLRTNVFFNAFSRTGYAIFFGYFIIKFGLTLFTPLEEEKMELSGQSSDSPATA